MVLRLQKTWTSRLNTHISSDYRQSGQLEPLSEKLNTHMIADKNNVDIQSSLQNIQYAHSLSDY